MDDYLESADAVKSATVRKIFKAIQSKFPKLELVIAWNQPMLKSGESYVFGLSVAKNHLLIAPWGDQVLAHFESRLGDYEVNKKTIKVPVDWKVDAKLLNDMVKFRLDQLK